MTVQLTTREKVLYECKACNETFWAFFARCYRVVNGRNGDGGLIRKHAESFEKHGDCPPYVYRFFGMQEPKHQMPASLERVLHPPFG